MDFIAENNLIGLIIGISSFAIIAIFHPIVIKCEYYCGTKLWWVFAILGIIGVFVSISTENQLLSPIAGVFGFSSFWTIKELFEQKERVKKGWFPKRDKKKS